MMNKAKEVAKRLREGTAEWVPINDEAADTIDALIAALEVINWFDALENEQDDEHYLYTAPQTRQPLMDEHIDHLGYVYGIAPSLRNVFARAIEAAHGIKGGAV